MNNTDIFNYNATLAEFIQLTEICGQNGLCLGTIYLIIAYIFCISFILTGTFCMCLTTLRDCFESCVNRYIIDTSTQFFPDPDNDRSRHHDAPPSYDSQIV